jgi:hypothetical protein
MAALGEGAVGLGRQEWSNSNRSLGSRRSTETNGREVPFAEPANVE